MKSKYAIIMMIIALLTLGFGAGAQVVNSCDQWANYCSGAYCVYNNIWGMVTGSTQCMVASSTTSWYIDATHPATSGVKSYANSSYENVGQTISALSSLSSSMNTSGPGTGDYCVAWDIWAPTEIMIWINKYGNVAPWGSYVETATIGGVTWDVYKNGYPGFLTQSNYNSMTVDVKAILDYCVNKGWLSSSNTVGKVQGGFEISGTDGVSRRFTMNSYSVSFSTGGTTTTVPTAAPTTAPTTVPSVTDTPAPTSIPTATPVGVTADPTAAPGVTAVPTTPPSTTSVPGTCTCANLCSSTTAISVPFTKDGSGEFCYTSSSLGSYVNSWNCDAVNVNGTSCTNTYISSSSISAINGVYYIYYKGSYSWSHLEIK